MELQSKVVMLDSNVKIEEIRLRKMEDIILKCQKQQYYQIRFLGHMVIGIQISMVTYMDINA